MAGPVLVASAVVRCPHGGVVQIAFVDPRVRFGGAHAVRPGLHPINGCTFVDNGKASPCRQVLWSGDSVSVTASGQPLITRPEAGVCLGPGDVSQGSPMVLSPGQTRADAV